MTQPLAAAALLAAALAIAAPAAAQGTAPADSTMGTHGMLAFGDGRLYLSHLPLYHAPHQWQIVVEAQLATDSLTSVPDAAAELAQDRAAHAGALYTVEPDRFPLGALRAVAEGGAPVTFRATVYRGHFERGGTPIVSAAIVQVSRVVWMRRVSSEQPHPRVGRWVLFGTPEEAYLAHQVAGMPDFDQVARVDGAAGFSADELTAGMDVALDGRPGESPLADGETLRARIAGASAPASLRVVRSIYLERSDLQTL
jgi:hypothetical protein